MSPRWRWFLPGYIWALPHTLVGFVLAFLFYGAHSLKWHEGVLTCVGSNIWGNPGAQTHGWLVIFADEGERGRADLRVHEYTHVVQGFIGGPVYMLAYGTLFLAYYLTQQKDEKPGWHDDYRRNWFEEMAYRKGSIGEGWGSAPML